MYASRLTVTLIAAAVCAATLSCSTAAMTRPPMGAIRQADADFVRAEFLQRLRRLADAGTLFNQEATASIFNLPLEQTTNERDITLSCPARFRTITLKVKAGSWFHSLPSGRGHLQVPAFTTNPATVTGDPEFSYEIIHYVYCAEWSRLQDGMQATLALAGLPAFSCLTPLNIRAALPEVELVTATDGVFLMQYEGRLDDHSGTTLTFNFRMGAECALGATITQNQEEGLRYRRAQYKFHMCREAADREFCSVQPDFAWSDSKMLKELYRAEVKRCGTINSIYLNEQATGVAAPVIPWRIRHSPCDDRGP